ncbi:MAG: hypothetical protein ACRD8U_23275, partial [Pyrinomonadaceae bacterium]
DGWVVAEQRWFELAAEPSVKIPHSTQLPHQTRARTPGRVATHAQHLMQGTIAHWHHLFATTTFLSE